MNRRAMQVVNYLQAHSRTRVAVLAVAFLLASFALYLGIAVYALTTGPKAVGDYMQARIVAGCWIALATVINVGTASVLRSRSRSFLGRFLLSVIATVGGGIVVFGLIVARVVFFRG